MARATKKLEKTSNLREVKQKIWECPPSDWEKLLRETGHKRISVRGKSVQICCPYHDDSNPSASINTQRGYFKCFGCNHWESDPVRLVQKLRSGNYEEAIQYIRKNFTSMVGEVTGDVLKNLELGEQAARCLNYISEATHRYMCEVLAAEIKSEGGHRLQKYLVEIRKLPLELIPSMRSLGALPERVPFMRILSEMGVSQADQDWCWGYIGPDCTPMYRDGLVYAYASTPSQVAFLKLRSIAPGSTNEDRKTLIPKVFKDADNGATIVHGAFGLLDYGQSIANEKCTHAICVEGEHDQLSLYAGQLRVNDTSEVILAMGGKGHQGADFLSELGISHIRIVGDDDQGGREFPKPFLSNQREVSSMMFDWPRHIRNPNNKIDGEDNFPFDPDDAVKHHGFEAVYAALIDKSNYTYAIPWCVRKATAAVAEFNNDDVSSQLRVAIETGELLKKENELRVYAEEINKKFPTLLVADIIKGVKKADTSSTGQVLRVVEWIQSRSTLLYCSREAKNVVLNFYEHDSEQQVSIGTNEVDKFYAMTPQGDPISWYRDEIGFPENLVDPDGPNPGPSAHSRTLGYISDIVKRSMLRLTREGVPMDPIINKGQGCHFDTVKSRGFAHFVNGKHLFRIDYNSDNGLFQSCTPIGKPCDAGIIFETARAHSDNAAAMDRPWLPPDFSPKWFEKPPVYTLQECYAHLVHFYSNMFEFEYQKFAPKFLALLAFYTYIHNCITGGKTITHIMGPYASGKTTLLSTNTDAGQLDFPLTYHGRTITNYTAAGVWGGFTTSRFVIGLDEANSSMDKGHDTIRQILKNIRPLALTGQASILSGTSAQGTKTRYIMSPVIFAGATVIADSMDSSRIVEIKMRKNPHRKSARMVMKELNPDQHYRDLAQSIYIHAVAMAPLVIVAADSLESDIAVYNALHPDAPFQMRREQEILKPQLAIANVINPGSAMDLLKEYTETFKDTIEERAVNTEGMGLFNIVLDSNKYEIDGKPSRHSLRGLLSSPDMQIHIDNANAGVYFDPYTGWLAVNIVAARAAVFCGTIYHSTDAHALKNLLENTPHYVPLERARAEGALARCKVKGLAGATAIVFLDVNHIINDYRDAKLEVSQQVLPALNAEEERGDYIDASQT